jgi:Putative zinc dependent peptidase (DUF5700)
MKPRKMALRLLAALCFCLSARFVGAQAMPDFRQAEAMLDLLRSCHENQSTAADMNYVLSLPGTALVIGQQNISRRVTLEQYREVLRAACAGKVADVRPAEPGARAQKGVQGLTQDVAPSLIWGRDHISDLESSLQELRGNRSIGNAIPLARKYLPQQIALAPKLYVVLGGRAGAAAIDDQLYFDPLITAWRVSLGRSESLTPEQVVEFFAHETHHLGYGRILENKRKSWNLSPSETQAWDFLVATIMEGSATLLINGHEKITDLESQPDIRPYLDQVPDSLPAMQQVLSACLKSPMSSEDYARATTPFLDMGYHATGSFLLAAIEKKRGLGGLLKVMADPRRLLASYNECRDSQSFRFDPALANHLAHLGEPPK